MNPATADRLVNDADGSQIELDNDHLGAYSLEIQVDDFFVLDDC